MSNSRLSYLTLKKLCLENLGIEIDMAAVSYVQDMPFFEVCEGVFNSDRQRASLVLRACSEVDREPFFGFFFGKITAAKCLFWRP